MRQLKDERGLYRPKYKDRKTNQYVKSPTWWLSFQCKGCPEHPNGGLHRESSGKTEKTAAKRELEKKRGIIADEKPLISVNQIMLNDLVSDAIKWTRVHRKLSTAVEYEDLYELHLKEAFTGVRAVAVCLNPGILTNFVESKQKDFSPSRINAMLQLILRAYRLAANRLHMKPIIEKLETGDNSRRVFFTDAEAVTLVKHLPAEIARPVEVLNLTGWRLCEVLSRQKHHVIESNLILEAGFAKNKEPRSFPLEGRLLEILQEQAEASEGISSDWLFHDAQGKPFVKYYEKRGTWKPQRSFLNAWKRALEKAKLVGRVRHDFRRSATRRFDSMPDDLAMELTGHKSYKIFSKYKSRTEQDKREAVRKLYGTTKQVQSSSKAK